MVTNNNNSGFNKTICSICYEDLKPIVEDLQAISICGHVFHELCLQQWFEYSSSAKRCSCPVCKQTCSTSNAARLYFQSLGDQNDSTMLHKRIDGEEDPEVLREQLKRLEAKASALTSTLEHQEKGLKEVNEELCIYKENLMKEVTLRNEAVKQKAYIQKLLNSKSEDLEKMAMDSLRLQERNMALAKELAALKLVSDLNLEEDDILKFASLGNEANHKDTVDVLRKSLVVRNKSYKELMAKCNTLGRCEARSGRKLEKSKEKINKLKARIQELEAAVEAKDNEVLRALKASKRAGRNRVILNGGSVHSKISSEDQIEQLSTVKADLVQNGNSIGDQSCSRKKDKFSTTINVVPECPADQESKKPLYTESGSFILIDEDASTIVHRHSNPCSKHITSEDIMGKSHLSSPKAPIGIDREVTMHEPSKHTGLTGSGTQVSCNTSFNPGAAMDEDITVLFCHTTQVQPTANITKESPSPLLTKPGDVCFSGGLLGPDGTSRYLGKWCKRSQSNGSTAMQTKNTSGDLIAVGADGRGGQVKVLRSQNHFSSDKESSVYAKRSKYGARSGSLQIEHFFGRASQ
ncbi:uncharacterized protein LOC119983643 [Tripterygium wilfordii]|uniref:uncharacterized protein LOC119983643 n=1 Tax=Tripterygium wilfordii TaxID=458696 RepID=UPI0018F85C00|nr:uncharacterized protein LOC119983643 [Tripterygium wilfordii]